MEITLINPTSVRIKGKQISFLVNPPSDKGKLAAEGVLLTTGDKILTSEIEGLRLVMAGPGEYEVGGTKITGVKNGENTAYYLSFENIVVLIGTAETLKNKENIRDVQVAVLQADTLIDQSVLATVAGNVAILYGSQAAETVKALGKEIPAVNKYVTAKDKLPQEMEVVLLG